MAFESNPATGEMDFEWNMTVLVTIEVNTPEFKKRDLSEKDFKVPKERETSRTYTNVDTPERTGKRM